MNEIIFHNYIFLITVRSLIFSILLIGFSIAGGLFWQKKLKNKAQRKIFIWIIFLFVLVGITIIEILNIPRFFSIELTRTKYISLGLWDLSKILFIIFLNLFFVKEIRLWFEKKGIFSERFSFFLLTIVLWLISLHYIALLIFRHYKKFTDKALFKISNVEIDIYDLFFLVLSIALTVFLILVIRLAFDRLEKKQKIDKSTGIALVNISRYFIWTLVIILILQNIGFNISALLAGSAALLVGIGMGIQSVFNDFISGIILLIEQENKIGDFVEADDVAGTIVNVGFRTTTILTRDNIKIIIPNSKLVTEKVINWTKGEKYARVGLNVGVAYGSDVEKVKEILLKTASEHPKILKKPAPEVFFTEFGDSSLNFKLYFYTDEVFYRNRIISDLHFAIYKEFDKAKITIPFPQMDVHINSKV